MINYIVQVVLFQVVFLAVYDLFLQKETFFKWNRLYLIATPIISFIVPLLKFESFKEAVPQEYIVMLPEVMLNPEVVFEQSISTFNYLNLFFYVITGLILLLFLYRLNSIIKLIVSNKTIYKKDYYLVLLEKKQSAFSFFNFIFIDKSVSEKEETQIIEHELVHCKQYHTLDLLFFELLKIIMWFNPLVYLYQKRITLLHEYISDDKVVQESDKKSYFNKLLSETFNVEDISFVNQFYKQSLIKKRIAMITKNKSKKLKQLKYLLLIPMLGGMLMYSSCEPNEIAPVEEVVSSPNGDEPLILVDGKEVSLEYMNNINPQRIQSMNILKGETAVDEYGEKASSGVIKVELKKEEIIEVAAKGTGIIEDVPFAIIETPPVFPGCEGSKEQIKACLNKSLLRHVQKKFDADLAGTLGLEPGKKKIYIQFKILKNGGIEIVGARAPHPKLEVEARRVVNMIPKMTPGKQGGEPVNVTYMLPIAFIVEGNSTLKNSGESIQEIPVSVTSEKIN